MADRVNNYEQFVVVAETEWKFDYGDYETTAEQKAVACACGRQNPKCTSCGQKIQFASTPPPPRSIKQALKTGTIEWNIFFDDQAKTLEFTCQNVADGAVEEVHMELFAYSRPDASKSYETETEVGEIVRRVFTRSENSLNWGLEFRDTVFTIRLLKDRPLFPDFTSEATVIAGRWASDVKLRVGEQVFHVNKQLLVMHSEYFDLMFNGAYKEANQAEVELKHDQAEPTAFHDFLLVMFVTEALPNPNNVTALSRLANIYQVNVVRDKCQLHLWICRELPVEERYVLALENGNKELQTSIRGNLPNLEESDRIIAAVSDKAVAL